MTVALACIMFAVLAFLVCLDVSGTLKTWGLASALVEHGRRRPLNLAAVVSRVRRVFGSKDTPDWEDVSYSLAFHMRAGEPPAQALRSVATEGEGAAREMLRRVLQLYDAGSSLNASLASEGRSSPQLAYLAGILEMGVASGGDIPSLLCYAADAMRRQRTMANEVRSRLTEARATAVILSLLPWVVGLLTVSSDSRARAAVLADPRGRFLLVCAFFMWLAGNVAVLALIRSLVPRRPGARPARGSER